MSTWSENRSRGDVLHLVCPIPHRDDAAAEKIREYRAVPVVATTSKLKSQSLSEECPITVISFFFRIQCPAKKNRGGISINV